MLLVFNYTHAHSVNIRYEHNIITLKAMISYVYVMRNMDVNIRHKYELTVQRIVVSREHALSVGKKAQVNMEE